MKRLSVLSVFILLALQFQLAGQRSTTFKPSLANKWLDIALEVTANDVDRYGALPPIQARQLGVALTAMYDAWACYDAKAVGTRFGGKLRRPAAEHTTKNKETAISYAMLPVLVDLFPKDKAYLEGEFRKLGYDPGEASNDKNKPEGIGTLIAREIIRYRHNDGANQLGDEPGSNGTPYSDYTYYKPVNHYNRVIDPDRWHPLPFVRANGDTFLVDFIVPHWYRVKPFGLRTAAQFRAPEPPKYGDPKLKEEVDQLIDFNSHLDAERKATIEFMRDGPRSTGQAGHWLRFAQMVSYRDKNDLDRDVKLYFAVGNTSMDAFIACWETKRYYDISRPWTLVREYYKGKTIRGWGGPDKGTLDIPAERWHPYSPADFVSPPFPAYVSGHSTVSGACSKMLELFTGSDYFGEVEKRVAGIITETPGDPVSIPLPTFTATAELAGISRVLGGYHIQTDNIEGLGMGRKIAHYLWDEVIQKYFDGTHKCEEDKNM